MENLWKSNENLWKCMEIYGNVWKCIEHLWKPMDMYGNVWKCTEMYRNGQKLMEIVIVFFGNFFRFLLYGKCMENLRNSMENLWKCMDMHGNVWKNRNL